MSGPEFPDAPPPEVPEEFADAYRDAYRRALESDPAFDQEQFTDLAEIPPQEVVLVGTHRSDDGATSAHVRPAWRASRWFVPVVVGASALVLVLAAYAVGSAISGDDDLNSGRPSAVHSTADGASSSPDATPSRSAPSRLPGSWNGPVTDVSAEAISADCTAPASNDSAGRKVTYVPENAIDTKTQTAWRCSGTAIGQKLTLRLGGDTEVAEVGLIPGYAKTDPESGVDRYAENNRITRVRWTLGDGVTFVQKLDPDPSSRAVQLIRVPPTVTDTVTLEITAVRHGPRNTTAISEIANLATD
jgi:hypothetical protein